MLVYPHLPQLLLGAVAGASDDIIERQVIPYLLDVWVEHYCRTAKNPELVETRVEGFCYLFDLVPERLVAAWGISRGRHGAARDKTRMAGHPLSAGPRYHRGHAIPHTLGGTTDLNLVPQLGAVNIGAFRELERLAVATPGALYFTYWSYGRGGGQKPSAVQQGLVAPGRPPMYRDHSN